MFVNVVGWSGLDQTWRKLGRFRGVIRTPMFDRPNKSVLPLGSKTGIGTGYAPA